MVLTKEMENIMHAINNLRKILFLSNYPHPKVTIRLQKENSRM